MVLIDVLTRLYNVYGIQEAVDVLHTFIVSLPEHERFFRPDLHNIIDTNMSLNDLELDLFQDRYSSVLGL